MMLLNLITVNCLKNVKKLQSAEQAKAVELATHEQSNSKLWYRFRAGRITASKMKTACCTDPTLQASTLTFVRLPSTSENWRRTSRSCITVVRRHKWKNPQTCRYNGQIYFHWYKILGVLYKRALFDLQFVHNLFWLKLKWNARSKLFYCVSYIVPPCFDEVQGRWQN